MDINSLGERVRCAASQGELSDVPQSDAIDTERILAGLKDFQRKSGEYVYQRLYGRAATRRFLLADEVVLARRW